MFAEDEVPEGYDEWTSIQKIENFYFPELKGGKGYKDTSEATIEYNCLAWALGINWASYSESPRCAGYIWFPGVERVWDAKNIRKIFENHGYTVCDNRDLEPGYEKVVFYEDENGVPQHFARQLESGKWTSKLGELNDIEHDKLESIICSNYGQPKTTLRRARYKEGK
jgi:hypothetical protein